MGAEDGGSIFAVSAAAGIEKLIMLAAGLAADLGRGIIGTDIAVNIRMQLLDELEQEGIAGCFIKRKMECEVEILKLICIGLRIALFENAGSLLDVLIGHEGDGCTDSAHLKDDTGIHCVLKLITGELGDDGTPVGVDAYKTLRIKLTEGFPDGNVADAELRGDLILAEGHTTGQNTADDCGAKHLEDPVPCCH